MATRLTGIPRRMYRRAANRYVAVIERAVARAVRRELEAVESSHRPDAAAESLEARAAALATQQVSDGLREVQEGRVLEHDRCQEDLKQLKKEMSLQSGLNQSSFRERIAYRRYPPDARLINIGAGSFSHPRWTNLDVTSDHYESHRSGHFEEYDLNDKSAMRFEDRSVDLAYTSHTIEHVKDDAVAAMFSEVYRVLKDDGVFRVTCPDASLYYTCAKYRQLDRYFYRMNTWFRRHGIEDEDVAPIDFISKGVATGVAGTPLIRDSDSDLHDDLMAAFGRMDQDAFLEYLCSHVEFSIHHVARHINWWTHDKVMDMLRQAGFGKVWVSTFGGSSAAPMTDTRIFDNTVRDESLYVEAMK